jgi:TUG ubiquitin-like domain
LTESKHIAIWSNLVTVGFIYQPESIPDVKTHIVFPIDSTQSGKMASHVVVIDTSFRRVTIKVTPGKYLTDVLEEACGKLNLKSSNYGLK